MIMKIVYTEKDNGIDYVDIKNFNHSDDGNYGITDEDVYPYYEVVVKNEKGELVKEITSTTYNEDLEKHFHTDWKFDMVEFYTDKMVLIKVFE